MPAPAIIHQLVAKFEENRAAYRSGKYNEARLRQEFLDQFFAALGWDVYNQKGVAPQYADVLIEDSLEIEGTSKAPDYAFKVGAERKFFVEAKKPAVDIQYDIHPAYQLRRYAWNAHLGLSILTDFEDFAVYNCKAKPNPTDSPATSRELLIHYTDYVARWDEIAAIFSRDAVWKGALDRYAETSKGKKGTTEVDDEFLKDMNEWRIKLARNIALRNQNVADEQQLNYAVQMTIDRIIFLRICEDRGIEPEEQLKSIAAAPNIYASLLELFRRADVRYNSGLFNFTHDKDDNTPPDTFTPALSIDDKVLKEIIKDMYYPCPYIFKEIPVEILGQVYEQFLGQVIRLTAGHQAKVEEKPEVRKAGGVYYTPRYIVDYIVENTVGKLLEGKTPEQAAQLRIVDPACGSGSFLLGAFRYLIDWHEKWYIENDAPKWTRGKAPALNEVLNGYRLTTLKKKEILLNNLHGVDIDPQAVEVTKLSLLLKVLEEETGQLSLGLERALPDLGRNIQCGNSLIGWDYFAGQLTVDPEERRRVNPFEWEQAFPQVFAQGGFDAVIGNPPYIRIQTMKEWAPQEVEFYKHKYISASQGNYDIYVVFVEKGLNLLNPEGKLGFILPHKFFQAQFAKPIRSLITSGSYIEHIVHFGSQQVFTNATTYTCVLVLSKKENSSIRFISIKKLEDLTNLINSIKERTEHKNYEFDEINHPSNGETEWNFSHGITNSIIEKLNKQPVTLGDVTRKIFVGLQTSADKIYVLEIISEMESTIICYSKSLGKNVEIEKGILKPFLMGKDVHRYQPVIAKNQVIFPYILELNKASLMSQDYIKSNYPKAWDYLLQNKKELSGRENGKAEGKDFYRYIYPKNLTDFDSAKIMTPDIAYGCQFTYDFDRNYHTTTVYSLALNPLYENDKFFLLGLLNSKLMWFFLMNTGNVLKGGYFRFKTNYLRPFSLANIDKEEKGKVKFNDSIASLAEQALFLHKQTPATPQEHEQLQRQIAATDRQIDALVYQLYGLTDEEIRIVEGS